MPNKPGKRRFGSIRQLPSGRFQIRYSGPDGKIRLGENTYARERDAEKALSLIEAKMITGDWTDLSAPRSSSATTPTSGSPNARTSAHARSRSTRACSSATSALI